MSQYSKTVKQQLDAYERTFSTTLNTTYRNAFMQCKKNNTNCSTMEGQLNKVNDSLNSVKNLALHVKSKVDSEKSDISNYKSKISNQKNIFNSEIRRLNGLNDEGNASNILKTDRKTSMTRDYLILAYYACSIIIVLFLFHKQYKFPIVYFLGVSVIVIIVIFILAYFGIPYI